MRKLVRPGDNPRTVPFVEGPGFTAVTICRDFVKPLPEGSYVAMVFRVTGYDADCDGSALARLEQVNREGEPTGWEPTHLGLYEDVDVVLDAPDELHRLAES